MGSPAVWGGISADAGVGLQLPAVWERTEGSFSDSESRLALAIWRVYRVGTGAVPPAPARLSAEFSLAQRVLSL